MTVKRRNHGRNKRCGHETCSVCIDWEGNSQGQSDQAFHRSQHRRCFVYARYSRCLCLRFVCPPERVKGIVIEAAVHRRSCALVRPNCAACVNRHHAFADKQYLRLQYVGFMVTSSFRNGWPACMYGRTGSGYCFDWKWRAIC